MKRIKDKDTLVADIENFRTAFERFSYQKKKRENIIEFMEELDNNLDVLLKEYVNETWKSGGYTDKVIFERKRRKLAKAPVRDHVIEAAAILPYEKEFYDYIYWRSPAVRPGLGTNALVRFLRNDLFNNSQQEMYYTLTMDAHHYFPRMDHAILKAKLSRKVKDGKLLRFLYKVVDSYAFGAPLGIKTAQIFGQIYLADFDRMAVDFFGIWRNKEKLNYWCYRYITHKIVTARSPDEKHQLDRGIDWLTNRFFGFAKAGLVHYTRFVDNIIVTHEDKSFLYVVKELFIMMLERDYHVTMNKDYAVRPTYEGIRICGYVFYHEKVLLGKNNKQNLARHVNELWKKGYDEETIRVKQASRFGYAKHVNTINLIKHLGMNKTLGKIIKRRKGSVPFNGMTYEQKVNISKVITKIGEEKLLILLTDYKIMDSKIQKKEVRVMVNNADGGRDSIEQQEAEKCLAIRFKRILKVEEYGGEETYVCEKKKDELGKPMREDAEFYAFSGSKVLIDQAQEDFTIEDLPCPTVIQEIEKNGKKFYKFE